MSLLQAAQDMLPERSHWRRDFHMHPELGFQETRTSGRVAELLEAFGCRVQRNVGITGVIGELGTGSPCITLRADMDALPIQEANGGPTRMISAMKVEDKKIFGTNPSCPQNVEV